MSRVRLTQVFPFLVPLRVKQRKLFFYTKMKLDRNNYTKVISNNYLDNLIFESESNMVNEDSGYDIQYQYNKVDNLKIASKLLNGLIIKPNQTFSFWYAIKDADKNEKYKNGLNLVDGQIKESYGGGLCQLSNMLYWAFLHSPLTVVERNAHEVESFAHKGDSLYGVDATISEGWLDLKVYNNTEYTFQIKVEFIENNIKIGLLANEVIDEKYKIYNGENKIYKANEKYYREVYVWRSKVNLINKDIVNHLLYVDKVEIGYEI